MRVLVTGAYGLIGSACLARLHRDGHDLAAAGRSIGAARRRFPFARWVEADFLKLASIAAWQPVLADIDVVVNCVGVLQDGGGDDTQRVHVTATCALFDACERLGIRRVIHISAIGVDTAGPTEFSRTKAAADRHLRQLDLDWAILRPGLVLAPAVYGGTAVLRALAAFPGMMPLIGADSRIQVVSIDDVADTVALCARPGARAKVMWQLAHPRVLTLAEIVVALRQWLGYRQRRVVHVPASVGAAVAFVADLLGRLGWRSPMRSTTLAQLDAGAVGDPSGWMAESGVRPASLADILAARPANVQDRWFARLYFLKPLAIGGLAFHWVFTGIALKVLSGSVQWFLAPMADARIGAAVTTALVIAGAMVDIVLGVAVLVRSTARVALVGMLLVTLGAAAFNILMLARYAPQLWFELFGTVSTAAPLLLAILFALATLDDR